MRLLKPVILLLTALMAGSPALADDASGDAAPTLQQRVQHWLMPLDSGRVSSFFGTLRGRRAHGGIDFSVPKGTPVMATDDGRVIASGTSYRGDRSYGNVVVLEHEGGLRSLYAHLTKRDVKVGDKITAGEEIGLSGATGHATGPHLHLEAFRGDKRIDPNDFLLANLEDTALPSAMHAKRLTADEIVSTKIGFGHHRSKSRGGKGSKGTAHAKAHGHSSAHGKRRKAR